MEKQQPRSLAEIQRALSQVFTREGEIKLSEDVANLVEEAPPLSREARVGIYRDGYFLRLLEAFRQDFERVQAVIGDELFESVARAYVISHPSQSATLTDLGKHFSSFLEKQNELTQRYPFLPDLARFEWSVLQSFCADNLPRMAESRLTEMAEADAERVRLLLDSSVKFVETRWPLYELWPRETFEGSSPLPIIEKWKESETTLLIHRLDFIVRVRPLDSNESQILKAVSSGLSLGALCEIPLDITPETFQQWFQNWVGFGIVRDWELIN